MRPIRTLKITDTMTKVKFLICICVMFLLMGCAGFGNKQSFVTWHDGKVIGVDMKSDGLVVVELEDGKATFDNRGRPGFLEQIFGALLVNEDSLTRGRK